MEVIKLAHGIYQLSLKFKESLDKVKENRKAVEEFERQILRPIQYLREKFELLHDRGSQYEELRSELTVLRSELDSLLQKCKDMELHRGLTFKAWWNSDKIKGEIDSIQKRLESCRQIYLVHASFRTEIITKESSKKLDNVTDMLRRVIPQPGTSLKPPSIHSHLPQIAGPVTLNLNFPNVSVEKVYNTITTTTPKWTPPAHAQTKHKSTLTLPKIDVYGPSESDGHSSVKRTERGVQATTKTVRMCSQNNDTQDAQAPVTAHQAKEMKEMAKSLSQAVDRRISRSRSVVGRSYSLKTSIARRAPRERQVDLSTTSLDAIIHGTSIMTLLNAKALEADIVAVELDRLSVKLCELGDYHGACDMSRKAVQVLQDVCIAIKNEPSDTYPTARLAV